MGQVRFSGIFLTAALAPSEANGRLAKRLVLLFFRPALPEPDSWLERKNDPMMNFAMILFTGAMFFGSMEVGMRSPVAGGAARVLGGLSVLSFLFGLLGMLASGGG